MNGFSDGVKIWLLNLADPLGHLANVGDTQGADRPVGFPSERAVAKAIVPDAHAIVNLLCESELTPRHQHGHVLRTVELSDLHE